MRQTRVNGRFTKDGQPYTNGTISFVPDVLWLEDEDGTAYATLGVHQLALDNQGRFSVLLTRTDNEQRFSQWRYTVRCPAGEWKIKIDSEGPIALSTLIPKKPA